MAVTRRLLVRATPHTFESLICTRHRMQSQELSSLGGKEGAKTAMTYRELEPFANLGAAT